MKAVLNNVLLPALFMLSISCQQNSTALLHPIQAKNNIEFGFHQFDNMIIVSQIHIQKYTTCCTIVVSKIIFL